MNARELITEHLDLWTGAVTKKSGSGRGRNGKVELTGVKKLRELILELAVRGKLVSQLMHNQSISDLSAVMEKEKAKLVASKRIKKQKAVSSLSQENYPFDIPENWSWHTLGALGYTQTGSTPAKSQSELFGSDIPFLKPGDISESGEICYDNEGLSEAGKEALGKWAEKDSILMVCIGTIGKCGLIEQQCTFNQQVNSITPFVPKTSRFLLLCLKSPYFQDAAWAKSSSTTISILNKSKWESIPAPLPPLEEQHRIVQKVDELMALCDRLEQQTSDQLEAHETLVETLLGTLTQSENATELADNWARLAAHFDTLFTTEESIDKLKQAVLQLAVMGRLVEQDVGDEAADKSLESICYRKSNLSKAGMKKRKEPTPLAEAGLPFDLPRNWMWVRFTDIALEYSVGIGKGKSQQAHNNQYRYFKMNNIVNTGGFQIDDIVSVDATDEDVSRYSLDSGDLLFNTRNSQELVGKTCVYSHDGGDPVLYNNNILRAKFVEPKQAYFVDIWMRSPEGKRQLEKLKSGTTNVWAIYQGKLESLPCPIPGKQEQSRIVQKVDDLMALCDQLKEHLNQAAENRNHLAEAVVKTSLN